jgi:hypothetical protein
MHGFVFAVPLGQILPPRAGSQNPQNSVHKQPVIRTRAARVTGRRAANPKSAAIARRKARTVQPSQTLQIE